MTTSVSIRDLKIAFGSMVVIDQLQLEVDEGEFLVLLGPSGCGKSTLLNAIAGFFNIADGEIWIKERNVTWDEPKDRGIGMVFQSYALYPQMTVQENLSFGLRVAGRPKAEIAAKVARAAQILHLDALLNRKPGELSGGQRQRVAIGRALVRDVDVFLFDEPLSNLDAKLRGELRVEIKRLHQDLRNTMIYVTHDQIEAMTLADRIAIMKDGVIQQLATPSEIYHHPVNRFVANFIGAPAMNFVAGVIEQENEGPVFVSKGLRLSLADYPAQGPLLPGPATLGFRPEHLTILATPDAGGLQAQVTVVEPMGAETVVWFAHEDGTGSVRVMEELRVTSGSPLYARIDMTRASLFGPSESRL